MKEGIVLFEVHAAQPSHGGQSLFVAFADPTDWNLLSRVRL